MERLHVVGRVVWQAGSFDVTGTAETLFLQRWKFCKGGADSHPYAQWVSVNDPRTAIACSDLHGKAWRVDGSTFAAVVEKHFAEGLKDCRCKIRPVTMRALVAEQIQRMD